MLPYNSIRPRAVVKNVDLSYLLIRPVKVNHCGKPSIVDRIGEDGSSPALVHFSWCCSYGLPGALPRRRAVVDCFLDVSKD